MIETKNTCDGHGKYSYMTPKPTLLSEAISEGWWEIEIHPGGLYFRQPVSAEAFKTDCKHACCPDHAREVVKDAVLELIRDKVLAKEPESDIPY